MKIRLPLLLIALCCLFASSCVNLNKIRKYPDPIIEMTTGYALPENDSVRIELMALLPDIYRNSNAGIRILPSIVKHTDTITLSPLIIEGRNNRVFNERTDALSKKYTDGVDCRYGYPDPALYSASVPLMPWVRGAEVYADIYADAYTKSVYLGRYHISSVPDLSRFIERGLTERFYYDSPVENIRLMRGGEQKPLVIKDYIFDINSSDVIDDGKLSGQLERVLHDPEVESYRVSVLVSNSPEGSLEHNRELGKQRADAMLEYVAQLGIPRDKCSVIITDENWEGLTAALSANPVPHSMEIRNLIAATADPEARKRELRNKYPEEYLLLLHKVYPSLRRGNIIMTVNYKGNPNTEYLHTYDVNDGSLISFTISDAELKDLGSIHNSMLEAIKNEDYGAAEKYADLIPNAVASDAVLLNKTTVFLRMNRTSEATALLKRLCAVFPEARYNLGTLQLIEGNYAQAALNLSEFICINNAVANIYALNNEEAIDILLLVDKTPQRDYLLALACSKSGMGKESSEYLENALSSSPELAAFHRDNSAIFEPTDQIVFKRVPALRKEKNADRRKIK